MIARDTVIKIIDFARIEDVVGDFVTLKRRGSGFVGLCPFHDEKTPSFTVTPAKNIFKCFGCGKGGDSINFVMEHEHLSYPEALRFLADKYHIEIEETEQTDEAIEQQTERESLFIALKYGAAYFERQLWESEKGKAIGYSYFKERGLSDQTIRDFQLGYAQDSYDSLLNDAQHNGFDINILLKAGLIRQKEDRNYDFFRDRVMFPVHNISGKVVAFGGRILQKDEKQPKYINTPETDVYQKSKTLYGFYQAKNDIRKQDVCYLVEGYMDVIMLYQAGICNVVASSGTSLTTDQIRLIHRFTENIVILYDGDPAGVKAALRGLDMLLEQGMNVKVVLLPDKHDPDSYVREAGSQGMLDFIRDQQQDFIYFKASLAIEETKHDPVKKTNLIKDIVGSIALLQDPIKRMIYIQELARMMQVQEQVLINEVNKIKRAWIKQQTQGGDKSAVNDLPVELPAAEQQKIYEWTITTQERDIIRVLIEYGDKPWDDEIPVAGYLLASLEDDAISGEVHKYILKRALDIFNAHEPLEILRVTETYEDEEAKKLVAELLSSPYELSHNWNIRHDIIIRTPDQNYKNDVESALSRFRLVKVLELMGIYEEKKKLTMEAEAQIQLLSVWKHLDEEKRKLSKIVGSVILR
jgi:DNA primase